MKVIYTGFSKCGTKSMAEALRELGLNVHDFMDHYEVNGRAWMRICEEGGSVEDFRSMLDGVDAVTDMPAYYFWEEILDAFPDAKIIHCERESEDVWYESWHKQLKEPDVFAAKLMGRLSPTYMSLLRYCRVVSAPIFGSQVTPALFKSFKVNETVQRISYRRHNVYLREKAPKEKVLIWKLGDGWGPICEYLNLPVPDRPFPHNNKGSTLWRELAKTNPTFRQMALEQLISITTILVVFIAFISYRFTV